MASYLFRCCRTFAAELPTAATAAFSSASVHPIDFAQSRTSYGSDREINLRSMLVPGFDLFAEADLLAETFLAGEATFLAAAVTFLAAFFTALAAFFAVVLTAFLAVVLAVGFRLVLSDENMPVIASFTLETMPVFFAVAMIHPPRE